MAFYDVVFLIQLVDLVIRNSFKAGPVSLDTALTHTHTRICLCIYVFESQGQRIELAILCLVAHFLHSCLQGPFFHSYISTPFSSLFPISPHTTIGKHANEFNAYLTKLINFVSILAFY